MAGMIGWSRSVTLPNCNYTALNTLLDTHCAFKLYMCIYHFIAVITVCTGKHQPLSLIYLWQPIPYNFPNKLSFHHILFVMFRTIYHYFTDTKIVTTQGWTCACKSHGKCIIGRFSVAVCFSNRQSAKLKSPPICLAIHVQVMYMYKSTCTKVRLTCLSMWHKRL